MKWNTDSICPCVTKTFAKISPDERSDEHEFRVLFWAVQSGVKTDGEGVDRVQRTVGMVMPKGELSVAEDFVCFGGYKNE